MPAVNAPKNALDTIIRKSRVHLYKPIQIAEILYRHRTKRGLNLRDLESYRNESKKWRDEVSNHLVGRRSTSSQKYQDNLFESNAMPPELLTKLGEVNKRGKGFVESYIYKALETRLSSVRGVACHIKTANADTFSLKRVISLFETNPGLKRSIDKMYEILVYALFATIVRALKARVTIEIDPSEKEIIKDFEGFIKMVLGIGKEQTRLTIPAALYRVGVTNAADRGMDILANFGPAIQVKHLTLTPELAEDIADDITTDRIVIVCVECEKETIEVLLKQVGFSSRIQGIITINDLNEWYILCLSQKYRSNLGANLLADLEREFESEFPSNTGIKPFMASRGYDKIPLPSAWQV